MNRYAYIALLLPLWLACPAPTEVPPPEPPSQCGNGIVERGEGCDDGNLNNEDDCTTLCQAARCGDGAVRKDIPEGERGYESCDDANTNNNDDCIDDCRPAECGDGYVHDGVEACDDANDLDTDGCKEGCVAAECGDGIVRQDLREGDEGYEACDDDNDWDQDGCTNACQRARCGDGIHRTDTEPFVEQCDDGNDIDDDDCSNDCKLPFPEPPAGCEATPSPDGLSVFWICPEDAVSPNPDLSASWLACESFCMDRESWSAALDSQAKIEAISQALDPAEAAYWTGMFAWNSGDEDGEWQWSTGMTAEDYDPWLPGHPNFEDVDEDGQTCGWIRPGESGLRDARCDRPAGCICQWDGYFVDP